MKKSKAYLVCLQRKVWMAKGRSSLFALVAASDSLPGTALGAPLAFSRRLTLVDGAANMMIKVLQILTKWVVAAEESTEQKIEHFSCGQIILQVNFLRNYFTSEYYF